jgi:hypothetical protein
MITPNKLAKESESGHQRAFFAYCAVAELHGFAVADEWCDTGRINHTKSSPLPCLHWIHHIPNGGSRGSTAKERAIRGAALKAEGVRSGVADIHLPFAVLYMNTWFHGLYIEMKEPSLKPKKATSKGGMRTEQIEFKQYCVENQFGFATCYTWSEAVGILKQYLTSS